MVDDDPAIRQLIRETLGAEGLTVDAAADGFDALRLVQQNRPDVVVLDLSLPRLSGREVARRLRAACGADLPVLVVSADAKLVEHAQRIGAFSQLEKPFELDHLILAVLRGLELSRGAGRPETVREDVQPPAREQAHQPRPRSSPPKELP